MGNPAAGRGRGAQAMAAVETALRARGITPRVQPTSYRGHAVELAYEAARSGADLILALGGDGTVRDVVAGVWQARLAEGPLPVPVGILPGGTGNDLARCLGIPRDLDAALEVALGAHERNVDVWLWGQTPFINVAGVGLDASVGEAVNGRFRRLRGPLAYVVATLATLPVFTPFRLRLSWDTDETAGWEGRVWLAALANGRCYGGGMKIAPDAVPDDGCLDVVVVEAVPRLELLLQLMSVFSGRHVKHPRVHVFRARELRVDAAPQKVTLDGELLGSTPSSVRHSGTQVRVRVP